MSDTAAHLVARVLSVIAYRQWVLAYPRRLRLAFARDPQAAAESATIFLREVFRAQRKQVRREGAQSPRRLARAASRTALDRASISMFITTPCCPMAC
jgi:hypothetical protein